MYLCVFALTNICPKNLEQSPCFSLLPVLKIKIVASNIKIWEKVAGVSAEHFELKHLICFAFPHTAITKLTTTQTHSPNPDRGWNKLFIFWVNGFAWEDLTNSGCALSYRHGGSGWCRKLLKATWIPEYILASRSQRTHRGINEPMRLEAFSFNLKKPEWNAKKTVWTKPFFIRLWEFQTLQMIQEFISIISFKWKIQCPFCPIYCLLCPVSCTLCPMWPFPLVQYTVLKDKTSVILCFSHWKRLD